MFRCSSSAAADIVLLYLWVDDGRQMREERKNYYKILGVDESADQGQIKKAYRKNALKWHPGVFLVTSIDA